MDWSNYNEYANRSLSRPRSRSWLDGLRNGHVMHSLSFRDIIAGVIAIICIGTIAYQSIAGTEVSLPVSSMATLAIGYFFRGAENGGLINKKHSGYVGAKVEE